MKIIEKLMQEHRVILQYIDVFLKRAETVDAPSNLQAFEVLLDFIKTYADGYHHYKEEEILFAELGKPGVLTHCNPVQQMLFEHEQARGYVNQIEQALQQQDWAKLKANVHNYGFLLQQHIYKEDHILYPMAEQNLSEAQKLAMDTAFEAAEKKIDGLKVSEEYESLLLTEVVKK